MRLAVEQRDADVDDGVAGHHTLLHLLPHPLLHRGDELARDGAAHDLVDELEPAATGQRLHLDVADRELSVPAGLLDVPAVTGGLAGERLAQRHLQLHLVDLGAVPGAEPVDQDVGVRLTHAPQHDLVGLGVVLHPQRRILRGQPLEPLREPVLVGLRAGHDRDRQERLGHVPGPQDQGVLLVGEGVAGLGGAEACDRADVTGDGGVDRPEVLAQGDRQGADPLVLVVVRVAGVGAEERGEVTGDVHGHVRSDRAGEDADQRHPTHVGVGGGLDDLGDQRAVRVAADGRRRLACGGEDVRKRVLER